MHIGSEVFERIDTHDRVELVIRKRELAYVRIHRCHRTLDTGLAQNTQQLFHTHPEVARRNRHPTLTGEEDGGCAAAAAEIENPTSGLERERRENIFKLPERMRSHLERNDPPRVVLRRQWIAIGPDQRADCRHRRSLRGRHFPNAPRKGGHRTANRGPSGVIREHWRSRLEYRWSASLLPLLMVG